MNEGSSEPDRSSKPRTTKGSVNDGDFSGESIKIDVPEMDCPSCAGKVENSLGDVEGIENYDTRPTSGKVSVEYDPNQTNQDEIVNAVESAGYSVSSGDTNMSDGDSSSSEGETVWTSSRAVKTWISGIFLGAGLILEFLITDSFLVATVLGEEFLLADVVLLLAVAVGGQEILRNGYYSAKKLNLDIDFLMSVAILGAISATLLSSGGRKLYLEAATLAFLFSVAELLETYSMDQARESLRELMELSPDEATVRRDGEEVTVPVDEIEVGETVLVHPGDKIPMDGKVTEGGSAVDESAITGESVPVEKSEGDEVFAGTVNESGYIEVEVEKTSGESTLSQIIEMVENAESNKTEREQFVERFSKYYTPTMVSLAVVVAAAPPLALGRPWLPWFVNGITMLVLACPCAFVISTPVSVVSGITSGAKNGVLIKGGNHLEAMGAIDAIAFDKTGTLTKGELAVTDVIPLNGNSEEKVLRCAQGIEERSEHPIGEAIVEHSGQKLEREVTEFESITGKGVQANIGGVEHYAGKPDLFDELGFDLRHVHVVEGIELGDEVRKMCEVGGCLNLVEDTVPRLQEEGKTVVIVGNEDEVEGVIAVADEVRPESKKVIETLHELGVKTVMLTGDNEGTARAIASEIGIEDFRAELLPDEKVDAVNELKDEYGEVAMVGDGINDAPALATSTVGIAMGAAGTDTALETADIALMSDDLSKLPYLYKLSNKANSVIRENIWVSLGAKLVLAIGVPINLVGVATAVLIGDAGMTLGVTGNALRLSRIKPDLGDK